MPNKNFPLEQIRHFVLSFPTVQLPLLQSGWQEVQLKLTSGKYGIEQFSTHYGTAKVLFANKCNVPQP